MLAMYIIVSKFVTRELLSFCDNESVRTLGALDLGGWKK